MTGDTTNPGFPAALGGESPKGIFARHGWAVLTISAVTVTVELGVYLLAMACGAGPRNATLAGIVTIAVWLALAGPAMSAGGRSAIGVLIRGVVVADASAITLVALWGAGPYITLGAAARIYCTCAGMALFAASAVTCARSVAGRCAAAVAGAAVLSTAMATPLWIGGLLRSVDHATSQTIAAWALYINPVYSMASGVAKSTGFVWHQEPVMYGITRIGDIAAAPPVPWYSAPVIYGGAAGVLGAISLMRRRRADLPTDA